MMPSPSTVITQVNLLPKLTFLERTEDELEQVSPQDGPLIAADRLKEALLEEVATTPMPSGRAPKKKRIREWIEDGSSLKPSEMQFLYHFFRSRYLSKMGELHPEQRKVARQVQRFFYHYDRADQNSENEDLGRDLDGDNPPQSVSLASMHIALVGLIDHLDDKRLQLEEERPNSEEAILERDKAIELIDFLDVRVEVLRCKVFRSSKKGNELVTQDEVALAERIAGEFRNWIMENNPELVDAVMRLTPAATFLGILGMAGANMAWATPIVLAMCGGRRLLTY